MYQARARKLSKKLSRKCLVCGKFLSRDSSAVCDLCLDSREELAEHISGLYDQLDELQDKNSEVWVRIKDRRFATTRDTASLLVDCLRPICDLVRVDIGESGDPKAPISVRIRGNPLRITKEELQRILRQLSPVLDCVSVSWGACW